MELGIIGTGNGCGRRRRNSTGDGSWRTRGWTVRSTMPFVPAAVDAMAKRTPDVLVHAAGGIAGGDGLAAALMLGADGVWMGTRFYATKESLEPDGAKTKVLGATGDETIRTTVYDVVNNRAWPPGYTGRVVRNKFVEKWHSRKGARACAGGRT